MKYFDKICNPNNIKCHGLDIKNAKKLEVQCYKLLNSIHFPKLISIDKPNVIRIEHKGESLNLIKKKIKIPHYKSQIDRIINEFRKKRIVHLDMHESGKNICVTDNGIISIIDFDIAVIDNNPLSNRLEQKYNKLLLQTNKKNDIYDIIRNKLINIIENNKYLILN